MKISLSSILRICILFTFISFLLSISAFQPSILACNKFLKAIMGPDLVSVLVVTLTITFASVANVHLSIGRIISSSPNRELARQAAIPVRRELNSNAWTIFWAFLVCLGSLFFYGATENEMAQSYAISICLTVVVLNGLVMHDIYRSIFMLVEIEIPQSSDSINKDYN